MNKYRERKRTNETESKGYGALHDSERDRKVLFPLDSEFLVKAIGEDTSERAGDDVEESKGRGVVTGLSLAEPLLLPVTGEEDVCEVCVDGELESEGGPGSPRVSAEPPPKRGREQTRTCT